MLASELSHGFRAKQVKVNSQNVAPVGQSARETDCFLGSNMVIVGLLSACRVFKHPLTIVDRFTLLAEANPIRNAESEIRVSASVER